MTESKKELIRVNLIRNEFIYKKSTNELITPEGDTFVLYYREYFNSEDAKDLLEKVEVDDPYDYSVVRISKVTGKMMTRLELSSLFSTEPSNEDGTVLKYRAYFNPEDNKFDKIFSVVSTYDDSNRISHSLPIIHKTYRFIVNHPDTTFYFNRELANMNYVYGSKEHSRFVSALALTSDDENVNKELVELKKDIFTNNVVKVNMKKQIERGLTLIAGDIITRFKYTDDDKQALATAVNTYPKDYQDLIPLENNGKLYELTYNDILNIYNSLEENVAMVNLYAKAYIKLINDFFDENITVTKDNCPLEFFSFGNRTDKLIELMAQLENNE